MPGGCEILVILCVKTLFIWNRIVCLTVSFVSRDIDKGNTDILLCIKVLAFDWNHLLVQVILIGNFVIAFATAFFLFFVSNLRAPSI